jgi:hypothetical protein
MNNSIFMDLVELLNYYAIKPKLDPVYGGGIQYNAF